MSTAILGIDVGSSKICAVIAQKTDDDKIKIVGTGISKSSGIKKGAIANIDLASNAIKSAVEQAKQIAGTHFERAVISISGAYTKSTDSYGVVNVPQKEIGIKEINRVMQMADHNANIPNEYERIHALPHNFKVDDQEYIDDPLGMNGARLEVQVHIITAQRSALNNLRKAVQSAGVKIDNIVLNGYASSIAVLGDDEKELGVAVVDAGGSTCNLVIHSGSSIRYDDFLGIGSNNITNDLSMALHTPLGAAEKAKIEHGSLHPNSSELIDLPIIGDDGSTHEVSLDIVSNVIYARVEETLMILVKSIEESGFKDQLGAGIVLTGGFTKLQGIREVSSAIFDNMPVRVAKPKELDGFFETLKDPEYSSVIGLIMYGGGYFTPYEIDSNKTLRYKDEHVEQPRKINILEEKDDLIQTAIQTRKDNNETLKERVADIAKIKKESGIKEKLSKFWNMITQLF